MYFRVCNGMKVFLCVNNCMYFCVQNSVYAFLCGHSCMCAFLWVEVLSGVGVCTHTQLPGTLETKSSIDTLYSMNLPKSLHKSQEQMQNPLFPLTVCLQRGITLPPIWNLPRALNLTLGWEVGFRASDAGRPHPAFRLSEGPAPQRRTLRRGKGRRPPLEGWAGASGCGERRGAGEGARGSEDGAHRCELGRRGPGLESPAWAGPASYCFFIKPGPTGSAKPAAPSRGGLRGKMAPV